MPFFDTIVGHILTNRYQASTSYLFRIYVHGRKSSMKIKKDARVFNLPALCLESYLLFRWENALIKKLYKALELNIFYQFFFLLSSYDGRKKCFSLFFSIFISYFFSFL